MPRLSKDDLTKLPISDATRRLNPEHFPATDRAVCPSQGAQPKPHLGHGVEKPRKGKALYPGRCQIRITSVRSRLCDPDNLCGKYFVDALRYAGIIPDDRAQDIEYTIRQRKRGRLEEEHTEIEVIPL